MTISEPKHWSIGCHKVAQGKKSDEPETWHLPWITGQINPILMCPLVSSSCTPSQSNNLNATTPRGLYLDRVFSPVVGNATGVVTCHCSHSVMVLGLSVQRREDVDRSNAIVYYFIAGNLNTICISG